MSVLGQQLIEIVRRKAAEQPDFVYGPPIAAGGAPSCFYVQNGQPSCLIGQALFESGVIDASIENVSHNVANVSGLAEILDLPIDADELRWLSIVQHQQDARTPWDTAVAIADTRAERALP
jgi:hypothetical protein